MKNPIVIKCFYLFLMNRNLTNKNWIASRPKTELYRDLKTLNVNPLSLFIKSFCEKKIILNSVECRSQELYEKYVEWLNKNGYKNEITTNGFGMTLKNLLKMKDSDDELNNNGIYKRKGHGSIIYIFYPSKCIEKLNF